MFIQIIAFESRHISNITVTSYDIEFFLGECRKTVISNFGINLFLTIILEKNFKLKS